MGEMEHDELDQECWNVNSTRGYIFLNLYSQNIENYLTYISHAIAVFAYKNYKFRHLAIFLLEVTSVEKIQHSFPRLKLIQ